MNRVKRYLNPSKYLQYGLQKLGLLRAWRNLSGQVEALCDRWAVAGDVEMARLRTRTLEFVNSCHRPMDGIGAYAFKPGGPSLLYASCYAALILHLYGELQVFPDLERREWADYLNSFQGEDGIFRDPKLAGSAAEELDWWGWRHLTIHVLMALEALGSVANKPFALLDQFKERDTMHRWMESRPWNQEASAVSNQVQNYATMLQYGRDYQNADWCQDPLNRMYDWLDRRQNRQTGLWGPRFDTPYWLSQGVQTSYHLWMLYFYDSRPVQYIERIIDSCLATQNRLGGFGVALNSSACEDIDSIAPLSRLGKRCRHRQAEVRKCLQRTLYWILANFNHDGGAVFRRYEKLRYGHDLMSARPQESSLFPTWFRTLTLAYIGKGLPETAVGRYPWQFLKGPGHQFFLTP
jgi:hypothetical protein